MPAVRIEDVGEFVVAETLRQIRNGQGRLKQMGIETEPELEVQFSATIIIPGGLNAITRANTSTTEQTTRNGEQVTTDEGDTTQENSDTSVETPDLKDTTTQTNTETQATTDQSTKSFGRSNVVNSEIEE